jgi:hypothetical protein
MEAEIQEVIQRHTLNTAYDAARDAYSELDSLHITLIKTVAAILPFSIGILLCLICGFRISMVALKPIQSIIVMSIPIMTLVTTMSVLVIIFA